MREIFLDRDGLLFIGVSKEEFNRNRHRVPQEKIVATFSTHDVFFP